MLARRFLDSKEDVTPFLFQLADERPPTTVHMSAWVARTLGAYGIVAPQGFAYLGHSLRSGASSAIEAIRVPRARADWLGGWAPGTATRDKHYIDPTIGPTSAAYALFIWLLDHQYSVHDE